MKAPVLALTWGCSLFALTHNSALAQTAEAAATAESEGDIIVTAQRRSQRLVDVPISIATASSDDLQRTGPTSLENLTKVTPGVYLQRSSFGLSPTIRGIGSALSTSSGEQNVAVYVDEIYYATPTGNIFDLASVAGIEVLKGPQGTLFGRNATGGAILIRTLDPGPEPAGRFNISYERFSQMRASAYVNLPVGDAVAVNGSVAYRYSRGYVRDLRTNDITNQGKNFTGRLKMLVKPSDALSVTLVAAYANFDDPSGGDTRNLRPSRLAVLVGGPIATDRYDTSFNTDQFLRTNTQEYSMRARLELGGGTLSSFTALMHNSLHFFTELDFTYLNQDIDSKVKTRTFTQEVNYASDPEQPLSYVVGVYYFNNRTQQPFLIANGRPLVNSLGKVRAIAGYADVTYKFGDFSVFGGARYSYEKRRLASAFSVVAPSPFSRFQEATDEQWTPRLGVRYSLAERTNIYASYSRGFKSGVFDTTSPTGPGAKPESIDAFEIGFKTASYDFALNAAAFYYDYKNSQVNGVISGANGVVLNQLFNVPKARSYGAEIDASFQVGNHVDLKAAVAYTRARYIDFNAAPGYVDAPGNPASNPGGLFFPGAFFVNVLADASGKNMIRSPKFTASATARFHALIGENNEIELSLSPYYSSRFYFAFDNSVDQKAYLTLDGAITVTLDERVKLAVFGRNLTDAKYKRLGGRSGVSLELAQFATPRVYGVSMGYSF